VIQILEHEPHLHAHKSVITNTEEALDQVLKMVIENKVVSKNGKEIDLKAFQLPFLKLDLRLLQY
jgi:hypothetical protein